MLPLWSPSRAERGRQGHPEAKGVDVPSRQEMWQPTGVVVAGGSS